MHVLFVVEAFYFVEKTLVMHSSVTCLSRCLVLANHGSKQGGRWESSFYLKEDFCPTLPTLVIAEISPCLVILLTTSFSGAYIRFPGLSE